MSLKNWLFGSEEPGREKPTRTDSPAPMVKAEATPSAAKDCPDDSKTAPSSEAKAPVKTPVEPLIEAKLPETDAEVEHTQILTRDQIRAMSAEDRDKSKPIKFVPPPKPRIAMEDSPPVTAKETPSEKTSLDPPPPDPPVRAATWKIEAVKESWAPVAVADAFPRLASHIYLDHEVVERVLPGWRLLGASRRGRKQAHDARFREDAMFFGSTPEVTVLSVADGAGSSRLSRIGSHVAVREVVDHILSATRKLTSGERKDALALESSLKAILTNAVKAARKAVLEVADKSSLNPKEFRATLLTVVHWRDDRTELLLSNQVGDGAIALLQSDLAIQKFGDSDSGAFSGEVSCFLTDAEADAKAEAVRVITEVELVEALFICSDGIEDPFYPIDKKAADIFRQWHRGVTEPLEGFKSQPNQDAVFGEEAATGALARWLEFEKRGENDDRTVMVLHRLPLRVKF